MNILILNIVFHNLNDIQSRDVKLEKEIGGRLEERGAGGEKIGSGLERVRRRQVQERTSKWGKAFKTD